MLNRWRTSLTWSFVGGAASSGVLLLTTILAGRFLGPTEYGKFNFVAALSQIIFALTMLGMDRASLRFVAQAKEAASQSKMLSSSLQFFVAVATLFSLLYFLVHPFLADALQVPSTLMLMALAYGVCFGGRQLFDSFIRGLHEFKFQAIARLVESLIILLAFAVLFVYFTPHHYGHYALALMAGYFFFTLLCTWRLKPHFVRFDREAFKPQFSFAKIYFVGALLAILFGSLDKIVIGKYMSFQDLGIYGAYMAASLNFTSQLNTIFGNVFSPMLSKDLSNTPLVLKKIDRTFALFFIPLLLTVMGVTAAILWLLGREYPLTLSYVFSFSLLALLTMIFSVYAMVVAVYSKETLKMTTWVGNTLNLLFVGLFLMAVYWVGLSIQLVVSLLIVWQIANIANCKYALRRHGAYVKKGP